MGATNEDVKQTPWRQILLDLEFIGLEAEYSQKRETNER